MSLRQTSLQVVTFLAMGAGGLTTPLAAEPSPSLDPAGLPAMTLLGVIASGENNAIALFRDSASGRTFGKKIGDALAEGVSTGLVAPSAKGNSQMEVATWHVAAISRKAVTLTSLGGRTAIVDVGEQIGSEKAGTLPPARHVEQAPPPPRILFAPAAVVSEQADPTQERSLGSNDLGASDQRELEESIRRPREQISSSLEWSSAVDEASLEAIREGTDGTNGGHLSPDHEDDPAADEDLLQRLLDRGIQ